MSGVGWVLVGAVVIGAFAIGFFAARYLSPVARRRAVSEVATQPVAKSAKSGQRSVVRMDQLPLTDQLVGVMDSAAIVTDSGDQVLLANRQAREMGLVREGRVVVRRLLEISREVRRTGTVTVDLRLPARLGRSNGEIILNVQGDQLDQPGHVGLIMHDVTEAHRVEAVRRDFVANVSHELKTPVGAINLLGEAIAEASDDEAAVRRFAASMRKESNRLSTLIRELIELSRLEGAEPAPPQTSVEVGKVVAECVGGIRAAADAKGIILVMAGDHGLEVPAVRAHLSTVVTNLLTNAVSYSPDDTKVAVTYRKVDGFAEIVVKDQGIGIPASELGRIFERFYRVDPARSRNTGGTGLGLAIVKHIATNHGGSVEVWSSEGDGSTFTFRLPLEPVRADREESPERTKTNPHGHSVVSDTALEYL